MYFSKIANNGVKTKGEHWDETKTNITNCISDLLNEEEEQHSNNMTVIKVAIQTMTVEVDSVNQPPSHVEIHYSLIISPVSVSQSAKTSRSRR